MVILKFVSKLRLILCLKLVCLETVLSIVAHKANGHGATRRERQRRQLSASLFGEEKPCGGGGENIGLEDISE